MRYIPRMVPQNSLAELGAHSLQHGKPEAAICYLQRALARSEMDGATTRMRMVLNLCAAFNQCDQPVMALEHARAAIDVLNANPPQEGENDVAQRRELQAAAWYNCCVCYERIGRFGDARRSARKALGLLDGAPEDDPLVQRLRRPRVPASR